MIFSDLHPEHTRSSYQRVNFDKFLKHIKFSFDIPAIHIAGTNGKGSVAKYLTNIFAAHNKKVGLFQSPYFYETNEMISINGKNIDDQDLESIYLEYKDLIKKFDLSIFEIETFIAFKYFIKETVDIAIIECGMGGEFDATNIFSPILSIITSISIEHTDFLGNSIAEIAENKAGIIKDKVPVVISELCDEATLKISQVAHFKQAPIYRIAPIANLSISKDGSKFSYGKYIDLKIKSLAYYECIDATIALEAINVLSSEYEFDENKVRFALENTVIHCRMEIVKSDPTVVIDGAHNPEAISTLVQSVHKVFTGKKTHIIFASFNDKNIAIMLPEISLLDNELVLTTFDHPRARKEEEYFLYLEDYKFVEDYKSALDFALENYKDDVIIITGSLCFASIARKYVLEKK